MIATGVGHGERLRRSADDERLRRSARLATSTRHAPSGHRRRRVHARGDAAGHEQERRRRARRWPRSRRRPGTGPPRRGCRGVPMSRSSQRWRPRRPPRRRRSPRSSPPSTRRARPTSGARRSRRARAPRRTQRRALKFRRRQARWSRPRCTGSGASPGRRAAAGRRRCARRRARPRLDRDRLDELRPLGRVHLRRDGERDGGQVVGQVAVPSVELGEVRAGAADELGVGEQRGPRHPSAPTRAPARSRGRGRRTRRAARRARAGGRLDRVADRGGIVGGDAHVEREVRRPRDARDRAPPATRRCGCRARRGAPATPSGSGCVRPRAVGHGGGAERHGGREPVGRDELERERRVGDRPPRHPSHAAGATRADVEHDGLLDDGALGDDHRERPLERACCRSCTRRRSSCAGPPSRTPRRRRSRSWRRRRRSTRASDVHGGLVRRRRPPGRRCAVPRRRGADLEVGAGRLAGGCSTTRPSRLLANAVCDVATSRTREPGRIGAHLEGARARRRRARASRAGSSPPSGAHVDGLDHVGTVFQSRSRTTARMLRATADRRTPVGELVAAQLEAPGAERRPRRARARGRPTPARRRPSARGSQRDIPPSTANAAPVANCSRRWRGRP